MTTYAKKPSKIIGIQFSLLSPEEIERNSVAEITNKETYNGVKPKIGGLFDPRMGVLEPGILCPTDGENYINCPGHFGHIELPKPVFNLQPTFADHIKNILQSLALSLNNRMAISRSSALIDPSNLKNSRPKL